MGLDELKFSISNFELSFNVSENEEPLFIEQKPDSDDYYVGVGDAVQPYWCPNCGFALDASGKHECKGASKHE